MVGVEFFGNVDLASVAIWGFWIFFALLIFYIQRENQREGFPLERDDGTPEPHLALWAPPDPKTFKLPHGQGEVKVPSAENEEAHRRQDLALVQLAGGGGMPYEPTGDPMADGVGPAAWTPRADVPELDAHGHPKIRPLSMLDEFAVSAGRDPRGLAVVSGDGEVVGRCIDMWVDVPEQLVRFLTIDLNPEGTGKTKVVPIHMCKIKSDRVVIRALYADQFEGIPAPKAADRITKLEEEKAMAYVAGGTLYAHPTRLMPGMR